MGLGESRHLLTSKRGLLLLSQLNMQEERCWVPVFIDMLSDVDIVFLGLFLFLLSVRSLEMLRVEDCVANTHH